MIIQLHDTLVIGNSYGCTQSEGCDIFSLQNAVQQVVNAGIFMSVAAGNNGPSCNTGNTYITYIHT